MIFDGLLAIAFILFLSFALGVWVWNKLDPWG